MGDQNIGAFVQRLVISLPTRLPSSLLEMRSCLSIIFRVSRRGPQNCRSLGSPGFPVESCGFGQLRVVLFTENHMRGCR